MQGQVSKDAEEWRKDDKRERKREIERDSVQRVISRAQQNVPSVMSMNREVMNRSGH